MRKTVLEEYAAIRILTALLEKPYTFRELVSKVRASDRAVARTLELLIEEGLVIEEREEKFPRRRFLKLTEKGERIAVYTKKILEELDAL